MRMPKGVSPAAGRQAAGLSCSQHKMKVLSTGAAKTDFFLTGLSSPQMNTVPAGYFTQICNTTVAEQRANSLYSTPHGPEAKPIRSSSGRLPVNTDTSTANKHEPVWSQWSMRMCVGGILHFYIAMHFSEGRLQICFDVISHSGAAVAAAHVRECCLLVSPSTLSCVTSFPAVQLERDEAKGCAGYLMVLRRQWGVFGGPSLVPKG